VYLHIIIKYICVATNKSRPFVHIVKRIHTQAYTNEMNKKHSGVKTRTVNQRFWTFLVDISPGLIVSVRRHAPPLGGDLGLIVSYQNCKIHLSGAIAEAVSHRPLTAEARDLWWTKCHWDRFFSEFFGLPLSISFHRRSSNAYYLRDEQYVR
jgi:hypothetical protein